MSVIKWLSTVLLCGVAFAQVPANQCQATSNSTSSINCNIPAVARHHLIIVIIRATQSPATFPVASLVATDGTTGSLDFNSNCNPSGPTCTAPGYWSTNYAAGGAGHGGLFAYSSGTFVGSDTFTVNLSIATSDTLLWVGEYGEDLVGFDVFNAGVTAPSAFTTVGANDLVITVRLANFGCSTGTPPSGYTMEVNIGSVTPGSCTAIADKINVAPGTYNVTITTFANPQPTIAFGVKLFVNQNVPRGRIL